VQPGVTIKENKMEEVFAIVVLNDGETYTNVEGCKIMIFGREEMNKVDESGVISDGEPLMVLSLKE